MDVQRLAADAAEEDGQTDQSKGRIGQRQPEGMLTGGRARRAARGGLARRRRRVADGQEGRGQDPERAQDGERAKRPAPAEAVDQRLAERDDQEDSQADAGARDAEGQAQARLPLPLHHHHRRRPARGRHPDRGEQTEGHVEVPRARDQAVRPERARQQHAADQDEPARPEAIGERAQHGPGAAADQREDGEGAGQHRAAPAELPQQRDQEDAVGVPDPVGQREGDDGDAEGEIRRCGGGRRVGAHGRPTIPRRQSRRKPPARRRVRSSRSSSRLGSRRTAVCTARRPSWSRPRLSRLRPRFAWVAASSGLSASAAR